MGFLRGREGSSGGHTLLHCGIEVQDMEKSFRKRYHVRAVDFDAVFF